MQVIQCPVCHNPGCVEGNVSIAKELHKPIKPQESALDCRSRWACQKAEGTPIFSSWTCNTKGGCGNEEKAYKMKFLVTVDTSWSALLELSEQLFFLRRCLGGFRWKSWNVPSTALPLAVGRPGAGTSARSPAHDGRDHTGLGLCRILCWMWLNSVMLSQGRGSWLYL